MALSFILSRHVRPFSEPCYDTTASLYRANSLAEEAGITSETGRGTRELAPSFYCPECVYMSIHKAVG